MPTSPRSANQAAERERVVLAWVVAHGGDFDGAARAAGYSSRGGAYAAYQRALARIPSPKVDELRRVEDARLDLALETAVGLMTDTSNRPMARIAAVAEVRQLVAQRCRLHGLDAPTKVEIRTLSAIEQEIALLEAQLAGNDRASQSS